MKESRPIIDATFCQKLHAAIQCVDSQPNWLKPFAYAQHVMPLMIAEERATATEPSADVSEVRKLFTEIHKTQDAQEAQLLIFLWLKAQACKSSTSPKPPE